MPSIADMVESLAALTESHVHAATALDTQRVVSLAQERADLLFELRIRLQQQPSLEAADRVRAQAAAKRLMQAEHRLERTVHSFLSIFNSSSPSPTVYGRGGKVQEVSRGHAR